MKVHLQKLCKLLMANKACQCFYLPTMLIVLALNSYAQPGPVIDWQKKYGGPASDYITAWVETSDGYLIGGSTFSGLGGDKTENSRGEMDFWVVKIDKAGVKQWDKTFGGSDRDQLRVIVTTSDGFLLCGISSSGIGGDKSQANRGGEDYWVVKISTTGTKIWDRRFGGSHNDHLEKAVRTSDNGFILAGTSYSGLSGDKSEDRRTTFREFDTPKGDFWVIKINSSGTKVWDRTYGGLGVASGSTTYNESGDDRLTSLVPASEGFLLGGYSNSDLGYEKSEKSLGYDFWVVKINGNGTKIWDKTFGSELNEVLADIVTAPDGGFVLGGYSNYVRFEDEYYTAYASEVVLKKISGTNSLQWEKIYRPEGPNHTFTSMYLASYATGFTALFQYENEWYDGKSLISYNWQGVNQYNRELKLDYQVSLFKYSSNNEAFIGHNPDLLESHSYQYGLTKLKAEPTSPVAELTLNLGRDDYYRTLNIDAIPTYFQENTSKVVFYIDGIKIGEDTSFPFSFAWRETTPGNHKVKAVAFTSSGKQVASKEIDWRVFLFYGLQAEPGHFTVADPGTHAVGEEKAPTLNGGSSIKLWDIGDRQRFYLSVPAGQYVIKVRLRSGYHNSTISNPKSYWPDGYSFWVNNVPVTFTGDPNSISAKNEAYGGSYWGTMVSPVVTIDADFASRIEIRAEKKWAGVDYIELIPKSTNRIEAELNYTPLVDVGTKVIGEEAYSTLSNGSSTKIWDAGDKVRLRFFSLSGNYIIKARVRTGYYTSTASKPTNYWPNGYTFWLNGNPITLTGNTSTATKDPSYGGSYWGTMQSGVVHLERNYQYLDVLANMKWCGIDYLEIVPVEGSTARLAIPEVVAAEKPEVYPNPFNHIINVKLPVSEKKVAIALIDSYGNIQVKESRELNNKDSFEMDLSSAKLKPGLYLLKIKGAKEERVVRVVKK